MLKIRFLTVLAALCGLLAPLPTSAATLSFTGRIDGYAIPGNPDLSTLDFYFITALSDIQVSASMVVVSTPSVVNTVLDMSFFHPPNSEGDVLPYHTVLGNSSESFMLFAGDYIVAMRPRNSDFDGYWPLPAFANNDSPFDSFDYQAALTGDVRLNEIWRGRRDGTFDVTIVPEPNTCFTLILGGLIMTRRRRRKKPVHRSAWCVLPAILIAMTAGVGRADDGVLTWPSTAGMGYRLQRSMRPGLPSGPWLNLPITYLGTGGEITHRCFGLPPSTPSTGREGKGRAWGWGRKVWVGGVSESLEV
jgi:hypothetical protein